MKRCPCCEREMTEVSLPWPNGKGATPHLVCDDCEYGETAPMEHETCNTARCACGRAYERACKEQA